ncbi:hypothetical protein BV22DRAFT_1134352 [Leucogyrophana mollusca]|uniref:Uncharacterized protein n=1 Tax=Leucogyrophana mollusca TaxID=85980 RepID=A0ACB8AYY3_9AGAM|nr:hypothetical protein BV22DRAFT_1134352 [Leucogyrophana mollusca]
MFYISQYPRHDACPRASRSRPQARPAARRFHATISVVTRALDEPERNPSISTPRRPHSTSPRDVPSPDDESSGTNHGRDKDDGREWCRAPTPPSQRRRSTARSPQIQIQSPLVDDTHGITHPLPLDSRTSPDMMAERRKPPASQEDPLNVNPPPNPRDTTPSHQSRRHNTKPSLESLGAHPSRGPDDNVNPLHATSTRIASDATQPDLFESA